MRINFRLGLGSKPMGTQEDSENQAFKVNDRRRFAADGSPMIPSEESETPGEIQKKTESPAASASPESSQEKPQDEEGDVSLAGLVLSIAAGAQMGLGIAPHPLTGKTEKDLRQAKQNIDLLALLEEKTKGNLSKEEAQLLQALLYDLRMRYLEAKGQA